MTKHLLFAKLKAIAIFIIKNQGSGYGKGSGCSDRLRSSDEQGDGYGSDYIYGSGYGDGVSYGDGCGNGYVYDNGYGEEFGSGEVQSYNETMILDNAND